jgi:hypothetical protein
MDFICSLTGKSPSTTGVGSEGALTKAPFNALYAITDLNNSLLSFILTGYSAFSTAAGYIGNIRVDHDISLLIPEIWSRLSVTERDPATLIKNGHLEHIDDFEFNGETVLASRLGYRITKKFVKTFFGRVFENPNAVFNDELLKPELQDMETFVDGINNITEAQKKVAKAYFDDGSVEEAIPPIKALLNIMVNGTFEGKNIDHPEIRNLFSLEYVLNSDWYMERLKAKQNKDIQLYKRHIVYLSEFAKKENYEEVIVNLHINEKLEQTKQELAYLSSDEYLNSLVGTIGLDLLYK